jgi:hypothetical protein
MKTLTPETVRKGCQHYRAQPFDKTFSPGAKGRIIGEFNKAMNDGNTPVTEQDRRRHLVIAWVLLEDSASFESDGISTKDLSDPEWLALSRWFSTPGDDGGWRPRESFKTEARWVLNRAEIDAALTKQEIAEGRPAPTMKELVDRWVSGQGDLSVRAFYNLAKTERPQAIFFGGKVIEVVLSSENDEERYVVTTTKNVFTNVTPHHAIQSNGALPESYDLEPGGVVQQALRFLEGAVLSERPPIETVGALTKEALIEPAIPVPTGFDDEPISYDDEMCFP